MEPIVYIPYLKNTIQLCGKMTICAAALWVILARTNSLPFYAALGILLLLGVFLMLVSVRFRTFLVLDWNGIHVMHTKNGELLLVPWSQIRSCKFYPGVYDSPAVCVLFQSIDYMIDGKYLYSMEGPIELKREGKKILCDRALLKLSRSKMAPEELSRLKVIGITATKEQYSCIKGWIEQESEAATALN